MNRKNSPAKIFLWITAALAATVIASSGVNVNSDVNGNVNGDGNVNVNDNVNDNDKVNVNDNVYDLYIMSLCPYGIHALGDIVELNRVFPLKEWNVWFIGRAEGDKLSSLRGEPEIFDESLWLGVRELYPSRYREFLVLRGRSQAPTESILTGMGLDVDKLRAWAKETGPGVLRQHYIRSTQLGVNASPTMYVNNIKYDKRIGGGRLLMEACRAADPKPQACLDYPECVSDADCQQQGKLGRCVGAGGNISDTADGAGKPARAVCEFRDDAAFTLTTLVADTAMDAPETAVIDRMTEILPGAKTETVKLSSPKGRQLMQTYSPDALPFIVLDKNVEQAFRFASVKNMLVPITTKNNEGSGGRQRADAPPPNNTMTAEDGYTLNDGIVKPNYFPKREEKPGLIELYADPLTPSIGGAVNTILGNPDFAESIIIRPLFTRAPSEQEPQPQDILRGEEALRWLVLSRDFPKKYHDYLSFYSIAPGSSYWFYWLKPVRLSRNKFLRRIDARQPELEPYREDLSQISSGETMFILVNNRLKVTVRGVWELKGVLESMSGLFSESQSQSL